MMTLNCKGKLLKLDVPVVMGIINTTPDSFYVGSRQDTIDLALAKAEEMIKDGASILDIGGQSTRPGSEQITTDKEKERVIPIIEAIHERFPDTVISVDTFHAKVAESAIAAGAAMVNDIGGGFFDPAMMEAIAKWQVPYVCMHIVGTPATMHQVPDYSNITREVLDYFVENLAFCRQWGIKDVIIDPGFGFSKSIDQNFQLLKNLEAFAILQKPVLLGISRKSTIYKTLGITPATALNGTTVLHTAGLLKGVNILRVHDVKEAMEAIKLTRFLM
jgi:dihydropteroate synthase